MFQGLYWFFPDAHYSHQADGLSINYHGGGCLSDETMVNIKEGVVVEENQQIIE